MIISSWKCQDNTFAPGPPVIMASTDSLTPLVTLFITTWWEPLDIIALTYDSKRHRNILKRDLWTSHWSPSPKDMLQPMGKSWSWLLHDGPDVKVFPFRWNSPNYVIFDSAYSNKVANITFGRWASSNCPTMNIGQGSWIQASILIMAETWHGSPVAMENGKFRESWWWMSSA